MPIVRQASREDVLDVAARVFAERGFGDTSLRQLIGETGMSPTAFYARYPSKQAVLEALVERVLSKILLSSSSAFARATNLDEAVEAIAEVLRAAVINQKQVIRLMMTEAAVLPAVRRSLHAAYGGLAKLVGSYLVKKRIPHAESAAWAMLGAMYFVIMRWAVFEELDDAGLTSELRIAAGLMQNIARSR